MISDLNRMWKRQSGLIWSVIPSPVCSKCENQETSKSGESMFESRSEPRTTRM